MTSQQNNSGTLLAEQNEKHEIRPCYYCGTRSPRGRGGITVTFDEAASENSLPVRLPPRSDLVNHSPHGFEWGYGGSGPAQLAFALCIHALDGDVARARSVYQDVKDLAVSKLPHDGWTLTRSDILTLIEAIEERNEARGTQAAVGPAVHSLPATPAPLSSSPAADGDGR